MARLCKIHPHHGPQHWIECDACGGDGFDGHDCGDDCCVCLDPEDNVPCSLCDGRAGRWRCLHCEPVTEPEDTD